MPLYCQPVARARVEAEHRGITRLLVTVAAENFRVLKLISPRDGLLSSSDYLAEYEAIVIKPEWARLMMLSAVTQGFQVGPGRIREPRRWSTGGNAIYMPIWIPQLSRNRSWIRGGERP